MKIPYLVMVIFLLLSGLIVSLFLTPAEYVQCKNLEPDECLDFIGIMDEPASDFSHIFTCPVDSHRAGLPDLADLFSIFHRLSRPSAQSFPSLEILSPVLRI